MAFVCSNLGTHLSLDETVFFNGDLYTIVTNKKAKGKKGVFSSHGQRNQGRSCYKNTTQNPFKTKKLSQEVTLDMAGNMGLIVKIIPSATLVLDRFHVQKLALDALQEIRIKHGWEALDAGNDVIEYTRNKSLKYIP